MKIGILQTGHAPPDLREAYGEYTDMFAHLLDGQDFDFAGWNVVDDDFPDSINEADGWLVTGSKHGAYEDLPWISRLETFLRDAYDAEVPIVGICFGHQVLAQALGGKVEKFAGGWALGLVDYNFDGIDGPATAVSWHQDQVTELPADATVMGSSDFCKYAGLAYGTKAITFQPHPEFGVGALQGLINNRGRGVIPDALLDKAAANLDKPLANQSIAGIISRFFKRASS